MVDGFQSHEDRGATRLLEGFESTTIDETDQPVMPFEKEGILFNLV